jgi:tRNA-specific 2-thiouridylase
LKHLIFPLAEYTKTVVRAFAKKLKIAVHDKPVSQEICFVGSNLNRFLTNYLKMKPGWIIDEQGQELGRHQGLSLYTLGQRSGIGLSGGPWYVVSFNRRKNELVVSKNFDSYRIKKNVIYFNQVNWLADKPKKPFKCSAQIRYHGQAQACLVRRIGQRWQAQFKQPVHAATPGQSIVFYDSDRLLGGGIIV